MNDEVVVWKPESPATNYSQLFPPTQQQLEENHDVQRRHSLSNKPNAFAGLAALLEDEVEEPEEEIVDHTSPRSATPAPPTPATPAPPSTQDTRRYRISTQPSQGRSLTQSSRFPLRTLDRPAFSQPRKPRVVAHSQRSIVGSRPKHWMGAPRMRAARSLLRQAVQRPLAPSTVLPQHTILGETSVLPTVAATPWAETTSSSPAKQVKNGRLTQQLAQIRAVRRDATIRLQSGQYPFGSASRSDPRQQASSYMDVTFFEDKELMERDVIVVSAYVHRHWNRLPTAHTLEPQVVRLYWTETSVKGAQYRVYNVLPVPWKSQWMVLCTQLREPYPKVLPRLEPSLATLLDDHAGEMN